MKDKTNEHLDVKKEVYLHISNFLLMLNPHISPKHINRVGYLNNNTSQPNIIIAWK